MSEYKYYINNVQVFPLNSGDHDFVFEKKEEIDIVFIFKLQSELIFDYTSGDFNFKEEETLNLCSEYSVLIKRKCNGTYSNYWQGIISPLEMKYDDNKCTVSFIPRYKEFFVQDVSVNILETPSSVGTGGPFPTSGVFTGFAGGRNYTQAKYLDDALLFVAQESNPNITGIISDFFQINPENASDYCLPGILKDYYRGDTLCLCALSDVQEPIPSNLATKENVTFKDLMADLNVLFDVYWFIDANLNLRIEHRTYFQNSTNGFDLTQSKYSRFILGRERYKYELIDYPKKEFWRIVDSKSYCSLTYSGCGAVGKNKNESTFQTSLIRTDYNVITSTGGSSDNGLFLFATNGGGLGGYEMIESTQGQNYALTIATCVLKFHRYGRSELNSVFDYIDDGEEPDVFEKTQGDYLAYAAKPVKLQEDVEVPFCCDDTLDTTKTVKTEIGDGYIQKASLNTKNNLLKLSLKYKILEDTPNIEPDDLTGLRLWLKADEGVTKDGSNRVDTWADFSGNNLDAVQANNPDKPTQSSSNAPISFVNQFMRTPSFQLFPSKRGTILMLHNAGTQSGLSGNITLISTDNTNIGDNFFNLSKRWDVPASSDFYANVTESYLVPFYTNELNLMHLSRIADTQLKVRQNGLLPATNYPISFACTNPQTIPNLQITSNPLVIGDNPDIVGYGAEMSVYEIIVYDRVLTEIERQKIELYLAKKWAFQLYTGI